MGIVKLKQLTDKQGNDIAPITPESAVYDTNGIRLSDKLQAFTNPADEEDITQIQEDNKKVLKLKDREHNPSKFSGKGYKILRKNIVNGKNVLTQKMVDQENTIYEIRYDYDLNNMEIIVPSSCIIKFEGGSFSNGTIKGNQTKLLYYQYCLNNCKLSGSFVGEGKSSIFTNIDDTDLFYSLICFDTATFDDRQNIVLTHGSTKRYDISDKSFVLRSTSELLILCDFDIKNTLLTISPQNTNGIQGATYSYTFENLKIRFNNFDINSAPPVTADQRYFLFEIAGITVGKTEQTKLILNVKNCDIECWSVPFRATPQQNSEFEYHFDNVSLVSADFCCEFYWHQVDRDNILGTSTCTVNSCIFKSTQSSAISHGLSRMQKLHLLNSTFTGRIENDCNYITAINCNFLTVKESDLTRIEFGGINANQEIDYAEDSYLHMTNCYINSTTYHKYSGFANILIHSCMFDIYNSIFCENASDVRIYDAIITTYNTTAIGKFFDKNSLTKVDNLSMYNSFIRNTAYSLLFADNLKSYHNRIVSFRDLSIYKNSVHINEVDNMCRCTYDSMKSYNKAANVYIDEYGKPEYARLTGTFLQKPNEEQGVTIGFAYYCTDKQTTEGARNGIIIYYAGDNTWVDALGRVVS